MITSSRHLHEVEQERDDERAQCRVLRKRVAELEEGLTAAQVVVGSVSRAAGMIDSQQVKDLRRQLDQRDRANVDLASKLEAAQAAISVKYERSEWSDHEESDAEKLFRAEERAKALERRVTELQAANEAMDAHRSGQPWIGEQQRAVTS